MISKIFSIFTKTKTFNLSISIDIGTVEANKKKQRLHKAQRIIEPIAEDLISQFLSQKGIPESALISKSGVITAEFEIKVKT